MSTILLTHRACLNHLTPAGHPERPDRLRAIEQALEDEKFQALARVEAPRGPVDIITLCHPVEYVEAIREASPAEGLVRLDADTAVTAMQQLPVEEREVMIAHLWGGLTFEEIAEVMATSSSSAHRLYAKGLTQLRVLLGELHAH